MIEGVYKASLVCSVIATIGLSIYAFLNTSLIFASGVIAICCANILTHIALIKGEQK